MEIGNSIKWHETNGVWKWIAAGLLSIVMFLSGFLGGQQSIAKTVEINGNRITALETIVGTLAPTLSDIKLELRTLSTDLNASIVAGN